MELENRSDAVKEILSSPPRWLVRWGNTVALLSIGAMLLLGWLIKFPDEISAHIAIKSTNPPRDVTPRSSGQLAHLQVREREKVRAGQTLAIIESDAAYGDVLWLDSLLSTVQESELTEITHLRLPTGLHLGELESAYVAFRQSVEDLNKNLSDGSSTADLSTIDAQIENIKFIQASATREQGRINQQLKKFQSELAADSKRKDLENKILELQRQLDAASKSVQEYDNKIDQLRQEKIDRRAGSKRASGERFSLIRNNLQQLKERVDRWKYRYVLTAPVDGEVVFLEVWDERQYVQSGEPAFAVKPPMGKMYATGKLPSKGSGKVRPGQKVVIKLESYPYQAFGAVQGVVEKTFVVPGTKQNIVDISLPNGLLTTQKKELAFRDRMEGRAGILTENRRVLEWLFERFLED
jgi:multidrug resistance efflux pump